MNVLLKNILYIQLYGLIDMHYVYVYILILWLFLYIHCIKKILCKAFNKKCKVVFNLCNNFIYFVHKYIFSFFISICNSLISFVWKLKNRILFGSSFYFKENILRQINYEELNLIL